MNSDQVVYSGPAVVQTNVPTAHSRQVHAREMGHLRAEEAIESKRLQQEQSLAYADSSRASMHKKKNRKDKETQRKRKKNERENGKSESNEIFIKDTRNEKRRGNEKRKTFSM
eukprot:Phypoly_transcript_17942.p2 GENE.Phypoly_transcript_17942~~Phypoly_transcript_17942.p2  ORF type:complete len:113 (+),score=20.40 Phypoly_transcript_17942:66-404(+)